MANHLTLVHKQFPALDRRRGISAALVLSTAMSAYVLGLSIFIMGLFAVAVATTNVPTALLSALLFGLIFWSCSGLVMETAMVVKMISSIGRRDYFAAEKVCSGGINLWQALPVRKGGRLGLAYSNLGMARLLQGHFDQAEEPLREAVRKLLEDRRLRNHYTLAIAINNLAVVLVNSNELDEAEKLSKQALEIFKRKTKSTSGGAFPLINLAAIALRRGRFEQAQDCLDKAQFLLDYNRKPFLIMNESIEHAKAACALNFALLRCEQGRFDEARDMCVDLLDEDRVDFLRTSSLETISKVAAHFLRQGEFDFAEQLLERAYYIAGSQPDHSHASVLLDTYADLLTATDRVEEITDMRRWIRPADWAKPMITMTQPPQS